MKVAMNAGLGIRGSVLQKGSFLNFDIMDFTEFSEKSSCIVPSTGFWEVD